MAQRWECTCDICGKQIKYMDERIEVAVIVADVTDEENFGQETIYRTPDFDVCPDCYDSLKRGGRRPFEALIHKKLFVAANLGKKES